MSQELMSEPVPGVRTFDQTGHICDYEAAIITQAHDPEMR